MNERAAPPRALSVFLLQHLHILPNGEEDTKILGVYSTRSAAEKAAERLGLQPGFREHPRLVSDGSGFYVDEYAIDEDHWTAGYFTE